MSNMSYCRFENTREDLQDCVDNWDSNKDSRWEQSAKEQIIELAREIVRMEGE